MEARLTALCLDVSLTGTGFAVMPVPLPTDKDGLWSLDLIVRENLAGVIENKDAKESEPVRFARLYEELWATINLASKRRLHIDVIAAEMAPHIFARMTERAIRLMFGAYAITKLMAAHSKLPYLECAPQQSKLAAVGYAQPKKPEVRRGLAFRCLGSAEAKFPKGYTEDVLDALTVGFWLDALYQSSRMGEVTALTPLMPREELAIPT